MSHCFCSNGILANCGKKLRPVRCGRISQHFQCGDDIIKIECETTRRMADDLHNAYSKRTTTIINALETINQAAAFAR